MIPKMTGLTMTAIKITKLRITFKKVTAGNNLLIFRWMIVHGNIKLRASQEFQLAGFKPIPLPTKIFSYVDFNLLSSLNLRHIAFEASRI
jgi:hypothetical protein